MEKPYTEQQASDDLDMTVEFLEKILDKSGYVAMCTHAWTMCSALLIVSYKRTGKTGVLLALKGFSNIIASTKTRLNIQ